MTRFIADVHTHHATPSYPAVEPHNASTALVRRWDAIARRVADVEDLLQESGAAGIDLRVLSAPPAMLAPPGTRLAPDDQCRVNEALALSVAAHPARLSGLGTVDAFGGDGAAAEVERCVRELGLPGVVVDCAADGRLISHPSARPALAAAAELGAPVFVHPVSVDSLTREFAPLGRLGTSLARGSVNAAALLSLLHDDVWAELPDLQVVFPMLGVAGLALAAATDEGAIISAQAPRGSRAHVYADTMGFAAPAVRLAVALLGADHVLVGSDWPIGERSASRERVDRLLDEAGLDEDAARLVAGENARRLFRIDHAS
jgi:predicted TIM-barrel fold metal-dependent hydrolase